MLDMRGSSGPSSRWSSIVWKLTVFVGVVVALDGAALIGVTYLATSSILRGQIFMRLRTLATLRQELLAATLERHEKRALDFAARSRVRRLLLRHAEQPVAPAQFRADADAALSDMLGRHHGVPGGLDRG